MYKGCPKKGYAFCGFFSLLSDSNSNKENIPSNDNSGIATTLIKVNEVTKQFPIFY